MSERMSVKKSKDRFKALSLLSFKMHLKTSLEFFLTEILNFYYIYARRLSNMLLAENFPIKEIFNFSWDAQAFSNL